MYLGEMCRVTLLAPPVLAGFSEGFAARLTAACGARMSLPAAMMADVEADESPSLSGAGAALEAHGLGGSTLRDRVLLREACVCVSTRAAKLSATAVVALLEQMGGGAAGGGAAAVAGAGCTVAVDGTVFEMYPWFKERMEGGLVTLLGERRAAGVHLVLAKDGSGVGAAIIAAIAK